MFLMSEFHTVKTCFGIEKKFKLVFLHYSLATHTLCKPTPYISHIHPLISSKDFIQKKKFLENFP